MEGITSMIFSIRSTLFQFFLFSNFLFLAAFYYDWLLSNQRRRALTPPPPPPLLPFSSTVLDICTGDCLVSSEIRYFCFLKGLLHEGDEIVEINGVHMHDKSVEEVCELLADMNGTLTFLIKPSNKTPHDLFTSAELHVRALFDYDPNDDEFIPCRELGLSFSKRDVLHIVNQEDTNWWQVYVGSFSESFHGITGRRHLGRRPSSRPIKNSVSY